MTGKVDINGFVWKNHAEGFNLPAQTLNHTVSFNKNQGAKTSFSCVVFWLAGLYGRLHLIRTTEATTWYEMIQIIEHGYDSNDSNGYDWNDLNHCMIQMIQIIEHGT